jgi:hypothetical protein
MLTATILTVGITTLTILIHYEAIALAERWHRHPFGGIRIKVLCGVLLLFSAHSLEIWLFAAGIFLAKNQLGLGDLVGAFSETPRDYLYFSVVTYTSLGIGDIRPIGQIRTICGFETLTGIMMMAWSAAFTVARLQDIRKNGD